MKPGTIRPRIVFFGTPEFAVPVLEALVQAGFEVVAVITQPDKPVGRGLKMEAPAVKKGALELGLKVLQPPTLKDSPLQSQRTVLERLKSFHAEVAVCVAYGKIIPREVLDLFPRGILNIHPSLLPKYRGPSPIQAVILNGDAETGVTIMLLDEEMDHGPILAQAKIGITRTDTDGSLSKALSEQGAKLLIEILPKYLAGEITPQPQDHAKATFTKLLEREDGKIDWNKPAQYIERMIRAYDVWPGTWSLWNGKRVKILRTALRHPTVGCALNVTPGYAWRIEPPLNLPLVKGEKAGVLAVNCNPGSILIHNLQMEGRKPMSASEFLRGYPKFSGSILK